MDLATKLKALREHAGKARGLERALTQSEVTRALRAETGKTISQGYLSQLESGRRAHLTAKSRDLLAAFFGVHPGYLVSDPESEPEFVASPQARPLPFHLPHPKAHHTLARLVVHPRRHAIWPLVEQLIDLPEEEFTRVRAWMHEHLAGPGEPWRPYDERILGVEGE
jgi:transcriptional regulator with XRE-family HTH domain